MTIDPKLLSIIAKAKKTYGDDALIFGHEITQPVIQRITSGSLSLDVMLGGGWCTNHWIEILGWESVGKTTLILKTIAANQKRDPNWQVVWFAAEDFVEPLAEMHGVDISRVLIHPGNIMEEVFQLAIDIISERAADCVVIDSLPALVSENEDEGDIDDSQPGRSALLTGKLFRKTKIRGSLIEPERQVTGFVINEYRNTFSKYGDNRTTPGGNGKNFRYYQRVEVSRQEYIKNTKQEPIGQTICIRNKKNKTARPGLEALIDVYFADGRGFKAGEWDVTKETFNVACALNVIDRAGSYYHFGGEKWKGQAQAYDAIKDSPALQKKLRQATLKAAGSEPEPKPEPKPALKRVKVVSS